MRSSPVPSSALPFHRLSARKGYMSDQDHSLHLINGRAAGGPFMPSDHNSLPIIRTLVTFGCNKSRNYVKIVQQTSQVVNRFQPARYDALCLRWPVFPPALAQLGIGYSPARQSGQLGPGSRFNLPKQQRCGLKVIEVRCSLAPAGPKPQ